MTPLQSPKQCPQISKKKGDPINTPVVTRRASYEDHDLSPPKVPEKRKKSFDKAVSAIINDWPSIRVEWVNNRQEVKWYKIRDDGNKVELPLEFCRIFLFLYGRSFMRNGSKTDRIAAVKAMLRPASRQCILQVMNTDGDTDLSDEEVHRIHYIRACLSIHRYFQQTGATGFFEDTSNVTFYFRVQKHGSCFLQAPCVAMSYVLSVFGECVPPTNVSRLIRHHFTDEQLKKYIVDNKGGDSQGIFQILDEKFFTSEPDTHAPEVKSASTLSRELDRQLIFNLLGKQPILVSRFKVTETFWCKPPSESARRLCSELDQILCKIENTEQVIEKNVWDKIPPHLIPHGISRFTRWDEPAELILLNDPVDSGLKDQEAALRVKWQPLNGSVNHDKDDDTFTTVAASFSKSSSFDYEITPNEGLSIHNSSTFVNQDDENPSEEDWSHLMDDDKFDDESFSGSWETDEPGEGDGMVYHAMILLGYRIADGTEYWLLQNSWEGPMQLVEVSTEYLRQSGASLVYHNLDCREPKTPAQCEKQNLAGFFCSSPIAESSHLERSDCESWPNNTLP